MLKVSAQCREQDGEKLYDVLLEDRLEIGMSEARVCALLGCIGQALVDVLEVHVAQGTNEALADVLETAKKIASLKMAAILTRDDEPTDEAGALSLGSTRDDGVLLWLGGSGPMHLTMDDALRAIIAIRRALPYRR